MYSKLRTGLVAAKEAKDKAAIGDLICAIDAVDKKVFAERKKAGDDFIVEDSVVTAVLKNQIKNVRKDLDKALGLVGVTDATESMQATVDLLSFYLPEPITGDELRLAIQSLGAKNMGQAMGMLKKQAADQGFDYDGQEAAGIAKEIFV